MHVVEALEAADARDRELQPQQGGPGRTS
jgi:hypothetical protein